MRSRTVAVVLTLGLAIACSGSKPLTRATVELTNGSRTLSFRVEVAATNAERARGLMDRRSLADGAGMLFLFPAPTYTGFWMKDTLIPLDIAFINDDAVVAVRSMIPCRTSPCPITTPATSYDAALEVNPGSLSGIEAGARVRVVGELPKVS